MATSNNTDALQQLGERIRELYTRSGFGKVLKPEIDAAVFHALLREELSPIAGLVWRRASSPSPCLFGRVYRS
jgi:hypothetical protein